MTRLKLVNSNFVRVTDLEVWKKVPFANNYSVSNFGRVRKDHTRPGGREPKVVTCNKILRPYTIKRTRVNVCINRKHYSLKKLVADAFLPPAGVGMIIHLDGDPFNCEVTNLYRQRCKKKQYFTGRLTPENRVAILEGVKHGASGHALAKRFLVSHTVIYRFRTALLRRRKEWRETKSDSIIQGPT